jgi:AraC-like DNA-binding protein
MARRGFGSTALRAALGAVTGVAEGLQQRDVVAAEKKRMADAASRQAMLDALATEDRAQAKEDRLRSQRERLLGGGYVREGMDMPGATPRKAVNTEMVGGERYSVYETPQQMARRAAIEEATFKAKFKPEATMTPYQAEMIRQRELDRAARGRTSAGASGGAGGMKPPTATDATKEAQGIKFLQSNTSNQEVILAIQKAIEDNPSLADRPGLIGYGLMQQSERKARSDAASKPKAGGRTLSNPPGMTKPAAEGDVFAAEWKKYNPKGGK